MYQLFDRVVELRVGDTDITGLDIAFEIEKDLSPEPNPCHIEVFNLSKKNRDILSKYDRVPVLLKAGYKQHVCVIFQGDMLSCKHLKEGPTWKTILASGDGAASIQTARINKSFSKDTPVKTVIKEIAKQLNLPSDNALKQLEGLLKKLPRGFSVCGNAMDQLSHIVRQHGYEASVQNNSLQILKQGSAIDNQTIKLNADSGLKGSPQIGSDRTIQVNAVLMPELLPGAKVYIESKVFSGFASIKSLRFDGATFGDAWDAEIVCIVGL